MRGGRRAGAGRKPGVLSRSTIEAGKAMAPIGECALGVLVEAMQNPKAPSSCRIQAASILCDRAYGRSPQSLSLAVTQKLNQLTLAELYELEGRLAAEQRMIDVTPAETDISSADDK